MIFSRLACFIFLRLVLASPSCSRSLLKYLALKGFSVAGEICEFFPCSLTCLSGFNPEDLVIGSGVSDGFLDSFFISFIFSSLGNADPDITSLISSGAKIFSSSGGSWSISMISSGFKSFSW